LYSTLMLPNKLGLIFKLKNAGQYVFHYNPPPRGGGINRINLAFGEKIDENKEKIRKKRTK
jgi:hypothetical protein